MEQYRPGEPRFSSPVRWSSTSYLPISDLGMRTCPPLVPLALRPPGFGFRTVQGGIDQGDHRFVPGLLWPWMYGRTSDPKLPHRAGWYRPGGPSFSSPDCWRCGCMEGFQVQGWALFSPGGAGSVNLRLGFLYHARRCRPGGTSFSSPVSRSCRCIE